MVAPRPFLVQGRPTRKMPAMAAPSPPFFALLAGGRGTRFWPLSRRLRPKQLLDVTGEGPMLRRTLERVGPLATEGRILLVTSEDLAPGSARMLGLRARDVLAEPAGRNTAPAVALACAAAMARDPNAVVACLPADHHVGNEARLRVLLRRALGEAARRRVPVLLGVEPGGPSSDYGYIVPGADAGSGLRRVARFAEKPDAAAARRLLRRGATWNSGMFVLPARETLDAIRRFAPQLADAVASLPIARGGAALRRALRSAWPSLPSLSFDATILERWDAVHVLRAENLGWSDLGSWEALASMIPPDAARNRSHGPAFFHEAAGCFTYVSGRDRTIVVLGADDLVVVDAGDVVFACPRSALPRLRNLVERLDRERPELT
jgi:mannose-1-phosphate guanylyltransferase/mannose-6-phosphate isomerase